MGANFFFSTAQLESWLAEDVGYFDLTSHVLGLDQQVSRIRWLSRNELTIAGSEEVARMLQQLGATATHVVPSGTSVRAGVTIVEGTGPAHALLNAWKVGQNLLEYSCAVASRSAALVAAVHTVNPNLAILSTRKHPPGLRALAQKAAFSGGVFPHRLGLSETVLVFPQHRALLSHGWESVAQALRHYRANLIEKKIVLEAESFEEAIKCVEIGADVVQLDKLSPEALTELVPKLKEHAPHVAILAAGGIRADNAVAYAQTGVDGLVTSSLYFGPPADIGVELTR